MNRAVNVALLVMVCITVMLATLSIHKAQHIHPLAIALIVTLGLCSLCCIAAVFSDSSTARYIRNGLLALSLVLLIVTAASWPGGDDGPLMGLMWLVGPFILFGMVLGVLSNYLNARR